MTTTCVAVFRKGKPSNTSMVYFTSGSDIAAPIHHREVSIEQVKGEPKWNKFFHTEREQPRAPLMELVKVGNFFKVKRGIATGGNKFFILSEKEWKLHAIPDDFLIPIIPSPKHLLVNEIEAQEGTKNPLVEPKLFLLQCGSFTEDQLKRDFQHVWKYLQAGEKQKINKGFLCGRRNPWYKQETREPAPILLTYMGRKTKGKNTPLRFILNHSRAITLNNYLVLYPKFEMTPFQLRHMWERLNQMSEREWKESGRVYSGGLYKVEPAELKMLKVEVNKDLFQNARKKK
jgi:hypothetical protein